MKGINRIFICISLLFLGCQSSTKTQEASFKQLSNQIDLYANNCLKKGNINSLAIAIYKDGQVYQNYYGSAYKDSRKLPNDKTVYEIASITKVFVGSLAAKAVLENKIAIDDDIRNYLKGDYSNLEYEGTPITIKNLLTHTLGFKNRKPQKLEEIENKIASGYYENRSIAYNMKDFLEELKTIELDKKPGSFYQYNSIGPELVAYILEQVYRDSFKNILSRFLDELDMKDTYLENSQEQQSKNLMDGFDETGILAPKSKSPLLGGGGGMLSTLPDLVKFMKFQLESNNPLIKESTKTLFENNDDDKLGYLWEVGNAEEEGFYYLKSGTSYGIQSIILICPDTNYGLILLANNTSEKAFYDWVNLYNQIEPDLIKYPKINLVSLLKEELLTNTDKAIKRYKDSMQEGNKYYCNSNNLNSIGYELLNDNKTKESIQVFKLFVSEFPKNANAYDSLGEAYFVNSDYTNALINFKKSLELNPNNENAKNYISKIETLIQKG
ncbi:serine hydrolase domain-containing protein [Ancylomarina sp. 16SWW S1-10-2]|uniref:serine hydrolase domain-containing protein n=1 Tax=Ancylomarina sp. 16SWW S1-10-2 TaxID=2499681 RepID=UPI0012ADD483|nr:serine hydrolase domain-containing protein [Ancylomarina sp. 16SWW S1-10-2]